MTKEVPLVVEMEPEGAAEGEEVPTAEVVVLVGLLVVVGAVLGGGLIVVVGALDVLYLPSA